MTHISPLGKKNNCSSLLSLENNYRHANDGAKLLTIRKLKSIYKLTPRSYYLGAYLFVFHRMLLEGQEIVHMLKLRNQPNLCN